MTFIRFTLLLLFLLILRHISSEEPEPQFRVKDSNIDLGYCFEGDIVVYKSTLEGDQLLGNSSDRNKSDAAPAGLEGRTRIIGDFDLLVLQIVNLTHADSGIYRWECWYNQTQVINDTLQLSVCDEKAAPEQIAVKEGEGAELLCNSSFIGLEGISVRWYFDMDRDFKLTLLLDSGISLEPSVKGLHGVVEVKDRGALLVIDDNVLKNHQQFACVVINGTDCLSFQSMYTPEKVDSLEMFASQGEEVVLFCPADGHNQFWFTPLGKLNGSSSSSVKTTQMYVSPESGNFSLIIPAVSDQRSGAYSCFSSTLYLQYWLFVCSKEEYQEKPAHESGTITVECRMDHNSSLSIKWYRIELSGQDELLYDSGETVAVPADLRDRLTLSEDGSLLTISDLKVTDGEGYWCVVLSTHELLERDEDYIYDFEEEDIELIYDGDEDDYLTSVLRCLSKQVTWLTLTKSSASTSEGSTNIVGYAVGGGLVGLLVIVATVVGVVFAKRAKASAKQRQAAPQSGRHLEEEVQLKSDPGCTEGLTPHEDVA